VSIILDLVDRPWVPHDAFHSTGDQLLRNGKAAVLTLNACDERKTTPTTPADDRTASSKDAKYRAEHLQQPVRLGVVFVAGVAHTRVS